MPITVLLAWAAQGDTLGTYRFPAVHDDTVVFTAEGDLWVVGIGGGTATRLTSHPGSETHATLSPDGTLVAFSATYEGPREIYTMPVEGGRPTRRTFEGADAQARGWASANEVIYATGRHATLPDTQLAAVDLATGAVRLFPLAQASDGVLAPDGALIFTRQRFQGSQTKRYVGGTAENLWRFDPGASEAVPLTADYPGTSRDPLWWDGRIVFASDRDGTMNLWSMSERGEDLRQLTDHVHWSLASPTLSAGRVVYQLGPDLRVLDLASGDDRALSITLRSDLDQTRERWVEDPASYLTSTSISPTGDRVALTARGQVFVLPTDTGRRVTVTHAPGVRYREATFLPDGKSLVALSDATGELEYWRLPADGIGEPEPLTEGGTVFRQGATVAPDGSQLVFTDKDHALWLLHLASGRTTRIPSGGDAMPHDFAWSHDSRWLAYVDEAPNLVSQIWLVRVADGLRVALTGDRVHSHSPAWSPDGTWLTFLSDRTLRSVVGSPWGPWQPEPMLDQTTRLYAVPLQEGLISPWRPRHELQPEPPAEPAAFEEKKRKKKKRRRRMEEGDAPRVEIALEGLQTRVQAVPIGAGNYGGLVTTGTHMFWVAWDRGFDGTTRLMGVEIGPEPEPVTVLDDIDGYALSADRKVLLVHRDGALFALEAKADPVDDLDEHRVDLSGWSLLVQPREEWRQMFVEAWRLERDFFYDRGMHGNDWDAVLARYLPAVDRVTDRAELSDLISQLVGELSALHIFVVGGDHRQPPADMRTATLGARLEAEAEGDRIAHIYATDPDYPDQLGPLLQPWVDAREGDLITRIDGVSVAGTHPGALLRGKAGRQVRLEIRRGRAVIETIVEPLSVWQDADLRYRAWEYTRRLRVEEAGDGELGYVHLRAMGGGNYSEWARDFYPVFDRKGLIVDVRHNRGGNIDSWILGRLMRKAWMYWSGRAGRPTWNMQYAFRGHVVVLCDEQTASDGEAFSDGFKRLGLGKVIGTRTWGGEIWLSFSNWLVDRGIASAAEWGVYGPEGTWLIEGHGVEPDIVVDNLPHATFLGGDAQLDAAIAHLQERIAAEPVEVPAPPPRPDKSRDAWDQQR